MNTITTLKLNVRELWIAELVRILEARGADHAWLFGEEFAREYYPACSPSFAVEDFLADL